jgi:hypothetical protein
LPRSEIGATATNARNHCPHENMEQMFGGCPTSW